MATAFTLSAHHVVAILPCLPGWALLELHVLEVAGVTVAWWEGEDAQCLAAIGEA